MHGGRPGCGCRGQPHTSVLYLSPDDPMTCDEQLELCTCGYCQLETMDGLLAALAKVEALHPYLPQQHLRRLGAIAIDARDAELMCERRECVMEVVDSTTIALCDGDHIATEEYWPGPSVWMSFENWAFGEQVTTEELEALGALPAAGRVPVYLWRTTQPLGTATPVAVEERS